MHRRVEGLPPEQIGELLVRPGQHVKAARGVGLDVGQRDAQQHVEHAERRLLAAVESLDLVEIDEADQCCGFGGTFAVKNAEVSMAMLEDKLSAIERSGAEAVTAVDNSCLMQIGGGLSRRGSPVRAVHLAEILAAT